VDDEPGGREEFVLMDFISVDGLEGSIKRVFY